jgi:hypothetical protein
VTSTLRTTELHEVDSLLRIPLGANYEAVYTVTKALYRDGEVLNYEIRFEGLNELTAVSEARREGTCNCGHPESFHRHISSPIKSYILTCQLAGCTCLQYRELKGEALTCKIPGGAAS